MNKPRRIEGRKIHSFSWNGARVYNDATKSYIGVKKEVEIRLTGGPGSETPTFNGSVENLPVYAEGTDIIAVRDECFAQLEKLYPLNWQEKVQIVFNTEDVFDADAGIKVRHFQVAQTKDGWLYRERTNYSGKERLSEARNGELQQGTFEEDRFGKKLKRVYVVCDPSPAVDEAIEKIRTTINRARDFVSTNLENLMGEHGELGLLSVLTGGVPLLESSDN